VYSTCSLEPEEDELIVDWVLKRYDLNTLPIDVPIGDPGTTFWEGELEKTLVHTRRFWPHKTGCEGFFIAVLRKA